MKVYIDLILTNKGMFVNKDETLPKTITYNGKEYPNNIIPVMVDGKVAWGLTPVAGQPYMYLRNRYKKAHFWSLVRDAEAIKATVVSASTNEIFKQKVANKEIELVFHFINHYSLNGEEFTYEFNTDPYYPTHDDNYVENVKRNVDYLTTTDMWGKTKLKAVIHNKMDNGLDQLLRGVNLAQLGNGKHIDNISEESKNYAFSVTQYYNSFKHDLKSLLYTASSITHKEEVEEEVNDEGSNLIYYRTWWQVDYQPLELHLPKSYIYIVSKSLQNSKYLDLHFDIDDKDVVLDAKVYTPIWKDRQESEKPTIVDYEESDIYEKGIKVVTIKNAVVNSRWSYKGSYKLLTMGDIILNPINKYNAASAMTNIQKMEYHCTFDDDSWLSKYVGECHKHYSSKEILEILKYSVGNADTVNEINYTHSNAMNIIKNDLINLNKYGYKGECWYRLIRDTRPVSDTADDLDALADNGDLESKIQRILTKELHYNKNEVATYFFKKNFDMMDTSEEFFEERIKHDLMVYLKDNKAAAEMLLSTTRVVPADIITFQNDIDSIIDTYPDNYREIGNEEYLVFNVR